MQLQPRSRLMDHPVVLPESFLIRSRTQVEAAAYAAASVPGLYSFSYRPTAGTVFLRGDALKLLDKLKRGNGGSKGKRKVPSPAHPNGLCKIPSQAVGARGGADGDVGALRLPC